MIYAFFISFACLILGIYAPGKKKIAITKNILKKLSCNIEFFFWDIKGISSWLELSFVDGTSWIMILVCCIVQVTVVEIQKLIVRKCDGKI
jgi:hypothetical protein